MSKWSRAFFGSLSVLVLTSCTINVNEYAPITSSISEAEQILVACQTLGWIGPVSGLDEAISNVESRVLALSGYTAKLAIQIRLYHEDSLEQLENQRATGDYAMIDIETANDLSDRCDEYESSY